jgi:TPR repeat protein
MFERFTTRFFNPLIENRLKMKNTLSVLLMALMLGLTGCANEIPIVSHTTDVKPLKTQAAYKAEIPVLLDKAEKGDALSAYTLSNYYLFGWGVEKNNEKNMYWMQRAADDGALAAWATLGARYAFGGEGAEKDETKAFEDIGKALELYQNGKGKMNDLVDPLALGIALNDRGLLYEHSLHNTDAAVADWCLSIKLQPSNNYAVGNLKNRNKTCPK